MDPAVWLQKALEELIELGPFAETGASDAWRAAVLLARLLGSPSGPVPPAELLAQLPGILVAAGSPDVQELLDRVAGDLDAEIDPWGGLLDVLLDADDAVGVLGLGGQSETALALARRVAALVSLYPERVLGLGSFAAMRLETVREGAAPRLLWSAVERAAADVLADALPPAASPLARDTRRALARPKPGLPRVARLAFPQELLRAAAESASTTVQELETGSAVRAWVYADQGRMRLELTGAVGPLTASLVAERQSDGTELQRIDLALEVSGNTAYADLGPWAGPQNALHSLVARTELVADEVRISVCVSNG